MIEFFPRQETFDGVGGLKNLKQWLGTRKGAFSEEAKRFGIDPPRGVLLLGIQGCGKSLMAKAVAQEWELPLLRLDTGALYSKYIGETETNVREAIRLAESLAPVVLWIDEIEKAFTSPNGSDADGGVSARLLGTFLSWMQEKKAPVFVVATANNIHKLPPELLRKGRFDEIFSWISPAMKNVPKYSDCIWNGASGIRPVSPESPCRCRRRFQRRGDRAGNRLGTLFGVFGAQRA